MAESTILAQRHSKKLFRLAFVELPYKCLKSLKVTISEYSFQVNGKTGAAPGENMDESYNLTTQDGLKCIKKVSNSLFSKMIIKVSSHVLLAPKLKATFTVSC